MNEEKTLPRGWTWTKLGDVVHIRQGNSSLTKKAYCADGTYTAFSGTGPDGLMNSFEHEGQAIILSAVGARCGKCFRADGKWTAIANTAIIRPHHPDSISMDLLFYLVNNENFWPKSGTGQPFVRTGTAQEQKFIPLAPLEEQKRIATQLDTLFSELDAGLAAIARARAKVKGFRASLLRAATSGELSAQWRVENPPGESGAALLTRILDERRVAWEAKERAKRAAKSPAKKLFEDESWKANYVGPKAPDPANLPQLPQSWCWASVAQLAALSANSLSIGPFGSNLKVSDYKDEGVPLVFVRNIRSESFGAAKAKYVSEEKAVELSSHSVESGEILITKMGEPPGDACLYPLDHPKAIITADCIKWKTVAELDASFFVHAINSTVLKRQIEAVTKGVAQQKISLDRFRGIATPLPPLAEQEWIVAEVERRLSLVSETEKTLDAAHKRAQSLKAAILARAFRGELCEQEPKDESADELLKRIELARSEAPKRGKRAKGGQGSLF